MDLMFSAVVGYGDFVSTLFAPENLLAAVGKILSLILIIVVAKFALRFANVLIDRLVAENTRFKSKEGRTKTITTLIKSIVKYSVYFIGGIMALQQLGLPVTSLLTAAGIGGLAVGFGAQNLVRDIITGFFILFEDQFNVGDYVEIAGRSGIVEEMGIRTTKLRDWGGQLYIIPNGNITEVTNFMGPKMRVMFDVGISYNSDLDRAIEVIGEAIKKVAEANEGLFVEGPTVLGVQELADSSVNIRVWAQTPPMQQWMAERILKKEIKEHLDAAGIEIPFPQRTVYLRSEPETKETKE
ncbi:MAG: mechanosensitive ion channel family protein [Firmicutes bacterium]|nr:mechanosensitive ion channel family protein [Bacillota bacterium]